MNTQKHQNKPIAKVIRESESEAMKRSQEARRKSEDIKIEREMVQQDLFGVTV